MSFIERTQPTRDDTPPWAGISFIQPVDSDDLHESLKSAYSNCLTLRERKHQAAIDFLNAELSEMQSRTTNTSNNLAPGSASPEEAQRLLKPMGSRNLSSQSPITSGDGFSTVKVNRPPQQSQQSPEMFSMVDYAIGPAQYGVFSATNGPMSQVRRKRKLMTLEEKSHYRAVRGRGACSRCRALKCKVCCSL